MLLLPSVYICVCVCAVVQLGDAITFTANLNYGFASTCSFDNGTNVLGSAAVTDNKAAFNWPSTAARLLRFVGTCGKAFNFTNLVNVAAPQLQLTPGSTAIAVGTSVLLSATAFIPDGTSTLPLLDRQVTFTVSGAAEFEGLPPGTQTITRQTDPTSGTVQFSLRGTGTGGTASITSTIVTGPVGNKITNVGGTASISVLGLAASPPVLPVRSFETRVWAGSVGQKGAATAS
jgi:hypothetical protein